MPSIGAGVLEQVGSLILLAVDWVGLLHLLPVGQVTVPCFQYAAKLYIVNIWATTGTEPADTVQAYHANNLPFPM